MVGENNREVVLVKMELELDTLDNIKNLFGSAENGSKVKFCNGEAELKLLKAGDSLGFDGSTISEILLTFPGNVAASIVGSFIWTSLSSGLKKLKINNSRTRITEETITEKIEITKTTVTKKMFESR